MPNTANAAEAFIHWRPERSHRLCGRIDVTADAVRVRAPTLILHGPHDQVIGYHLGRAMAARVPDARFVALDTSNHLLLADEPAWQVFRREVLSFLDEE